MISIKDVEEIHKTLIATFGGTNGIRDVSGLESELARPFQTSTSLLVFSPPKKIVCCDVGQKINIGVRIFNLTTTHENYFFIPCSSYCLFGM